MNTASAQSRTEEQNTPPDVIRNLSATIENIIDKDLQIKSNSLNTNEFKGLLKEFTSNENSDLENTLQQATVTKQEEFIALLYEVLEGINLDQKIALKLNSEGVLYLVDQHPDSKKISERLQNHSYLSQLFRTIATHSIALKDIRRLKHLALHGELEKAPRNYNISVKGDMNHFYFYT